MKIAKLFLAIAAAMLALLLLTGCVLTDRIQNPDGTFSPSPVELAIGSAVGGSGGGLFGIIGGAFGGLMAGLGAAYRTRKGHQKMLGQVAAGVGEFFKNAPDYSGKTAQEILDLERERLKAELSKKTDELTKKVIAEIKKKLEIE